MTTCENDPTEAVSVANYSPPFISLECKSKWRSKCWGGRNIRKNEHKVLYLHIIKHGRLLKRGQKVSSVSSPASFVIVLHCLISRILRILTLWNPDYWLILTLNNSER